MKNILKLLSIIVLMTIFASSIVACLGSDGDVSSLPSSTDTTVTGVTLNQSTLSLQVSASVPGTVFSWSRC